MKKVKRTKEKLEFNEKMQLWSDRVGLVIAVILFILSAVSLIYFFS